MSRISTRPVSSPVLDAAIAWQLCLDCGRGNEVEREEFAKWYAASEEHARAWMQLGMVDQRFAGTTGPARSALLRSRDGIGVRLRKLGRGVAGFALALGLTVFLGDRLLPRSSWRPGATTTRVRSSSKPRKGRCAPWARSFSSNGRLMARC